MGAEAGSAGRGRGWARGETWRGRRGGGDGGGLGRRARGGEVELREWVAVSRRGTCMWGWLTHLTSVCPMFLIASGSDTLLGPTRSQFYRKYSPRRNHNCRVRSCTFCRCIWLSYLSCRGPQKCPSGRPVHYCTMVITRSHPRFHCIQCSSYPVLWWEIAGFSDLGQFPRADVC